VSDPTRRRAASRDTLAAILGNGLDWYDVTVYGYVASIISRQFFPPDWEWGAVLSTYAIFAVSFVVRPLGGLIIGHYADIVGRRDMMMWVIGLMTAGTMLISFAPVYATIGWAAPAIIVVARVLQGLAASGEFGTATTFLVEHAPEDSRGFYGGWQFSGQGAAILLAGIVATLVPHLVTPEQQLSWGWRIPFLIGLLVGPIGIYIRVHASDTPEFLNSRPIPGTARQGPLAMLIADYKYRTVLALGLVIGGTAAFYVLFIFMPTYALSVLKLGSEASFVGPAAAGFAVMVGCPLTGMLSDRTGRKPLLVAAAIAMILVLYVSFAWLQDAPSLARLALVEFLFGVIMSVYTGPFSAGISELFPVAVRATAISTAYNFGVAVFGGLSPLVVAWLISSTGSPLAPAYYVTGCMVISLAAAIAMPSAAVVTASGLRSRSQP
jgi:MHS family proline/betaine transporter-like MFS transporter